MLLCCTTLLGSCTSAPSAQCQQLASAMPMVTNFSLALFLGLVSATSSGLGMGLGILMAAYTGWIESTTSVNAGCGIGPCRIISAICGIGMDWFAGACWGYALKDASAWLRLVGGAFAGGFAFVWGINFTRGNC
ncbi:MAG: hypothetical protein JNM61_09470 [Zoogloeaceae bacterium]|nr:hypothetical protein [Zoogloeaceae bacterium]